MDVNPSTVEIEKILNAIYFYLMMDNMGDYPNLRLWGSSISDISEMTFSNTLKTEMSNNIVEWGYESISASYTILDGLLTYLSGGLPFDPASIINALFEYYNNTTGGFGQKEVLITESRRKKVVIRPDAYHTSAGIGIISLLASKGAIKIDDKLRENLKRSIQYLLDSQNKDGGWEFFGRDSEKRIGKSLPLKTASAVKALILSRDVLNEEEIRELGINDAIKGGFEWLLNNINEDNLWHGEKISPLLTTSIILSILPEFSEYSPRLHREIIKNIITIYHKKGERIGIKNILWILSAIIEAKNVLDIQEIQKYLKEALEKIIPSIIKILSNIDTKTLSSQLGQGNIPESYDWGALLKISKILNISLPLPEALRLGKIIQDNKRCIQNCKEPCEIDIPKHFTMHQELLKSLMNFLYIIKCNRSIKEHPESASYQEKQFVILLFLLFAIFLSTIYLWKTRNWPTLTIVVISVILSGLFYLVLDKLK